MNITLDLHDFSVVNNRLDVLLTLRETFPDFKVSLFTVPFDKVEDWGPCLLKKEYLRQIKENLDWIQIIPHGMLHTGREVAKWDYNYTKDAALPIIIEEFKELGLPIVKGFCAPHWKWNEGVVRALDDAGWWGAVWKEEAMPYTKRFYKATTCINEDFPLDQDLKLHGHVYGTRNDLAKCCYNLLRLPRDTKFHFVTDYLEDLK